MGAPNGHNIPRLIYSLWTMCWYVRYWWRYHHGSSDVNNGSSPSRSHGNCFHHGVFHRSFIGEFFRGFQLGSMGLRYCLRSDGFHCVSRWSRNHAACKANNHRWTKLRKKLFHRVLYWWCHLVVGPVDDHAVCASYCKLR